MKLADKLRHVRNLRGLTQVELATAANLSGETISRIEQEETTPQGRTIHRLAKALKVSPSWLGDPNTGLEELNGALVDEEVRASEAGQLVPVFPIGPGLEAAWGTNGFPQTGMPKSHLPLPPGVTAQDAFYCEIAGDRMAPDLLDGDLVLVIPVRGAWNEGSICLVQFLKSATLARVHTMPDKRVRLVPANRSYPERVVDGNSEQVVIYPAVSLCRFLTGGLGHALVAKG